ncbi:MAG: chloride channel protein [Cyclobacteriaceae bacterium]|nr:chloride channel protein [Cyclobacteriaceae bacterium]
MQLLHKFLVWRIRHISDRNFLIVLGLFIGIFSGLAAVSLKWTVHFIGHFLMDNKIFETQKLLYIVYPFIGILLTVLISKYLLKEHLGHGITNILYVISKRSSIISRAKMYSRMFTSAITVGFGGSVGLEAPIVVTGSAIGSNIGRLMHLGYKKRTLLIACGAAGSISAIFNSPIAGVIFAIEVLLPEVTIAMFIPLLISSVMGSLTSHSILGSEILFSFKLKDEFTINDVPFVVVFAALAGLLSVYFTRTTFYIENLIGKIKSQLSRAAIGGVVLGIIILFLHPLYGEGYTTIKTILNGNASSIFADSIFFEGMNSSLFLVLLMAAVVLIKPVASAVTIGSGGSGGVFAPSLFIGGTFGFLFATVVNMIAGAPVLSISNFTLMGMSGVMSGVLHAPLTAIFLIAEITSGYTLFVPLMLVSAIAYSTTVYFEPYSLYSRSLAKTGDLIPKDKDKLVLGVINLNKIIETDLLKVSPMATLRELVMLVRSSKRNIFPVVNDNGSLVGIVTLDDIRQIMFDTDSYDTMTVEQLMHSPPASVSSQENMQSVMHKFESTGAWNLPVIDHGIYVGFLSKSRIFNTYRNKLRKQNIQA